MTSPEISRPIGVFDSGVGGLTVAAALMRRLPEESILYLGDTARLPYGTKSPATVRQYTRTNVGFLLARGVKAVVIACNTASALALEGVEPMVPISTVPTWGVIGPGAAAAAAASRGRVGVIATESTVRSGAYPRALAQLRPDLEVLSQSCPLFVPLVEEGWSDDPVTEAIARRYLEPLLAAEIDTLVLGCTHYPLLKPTLHRVVGDVQLVDSAETMAEVVARELAAAGLARPAGGTPPRHHLCVTDDCARVERLAAEILAYPVSLEWVEV